MEVAASGALRQSDGVEAAAIQAGEFHNLSYTKAARAILEKTNRKALTTQEILRISKEVGARYSWEDSFRYPVFIPQEK